MKLSIVTTLFNSEDYIIDFHKKIAAVAQKLVNDDFEIVFINDGSSDSSLVVATEISKKESNITTINLARNYGHHRAIMVGLEHASGDDIFLIDSDLEEKPEWLESFVELKKTSQADVVFGVQIKRKGALFERISGLFFWKFISYLSGESIYPNQVTARLMSNIYVKSLIRHKESELFLGGLYHITGFEQKPIFIHKSNDSPTTYSFINKTKLAITSITSFSTKPLSLIFIAGLFISTISFSYGVHLVFSYFFLDITVKGFTSIMASICFFVGLIVSLMGIMALYLGEIYKEIKNRPVIVKNIISKNN
jgi:putative glycosyltransferase